MKKFTGIPEISDKDLLDLSSRIKAGATFKIENNRLVRCNVLEGRLYTIKMPEGIEGLRTIGINRQLQAIQPIEMNGRTLLAIVDTYHTMSSMLNASVAEILPQIPQEFLGKAQIFEVDDMRFPAAIIHINDKSYHRTAVNVYGNYFGS